MSMTHGDYDGGGRRSATGGLPPPTAVGAAATTPSPAGFSRFANESSGWVSSSRPRLVAAPMIWTPTAGDGAATAAVGEGPAP